MPGCKDYSYETWTPDTTLHRTGEVSLLATFENLQTKVFMDEKGHGTWDAGDAIAVACSDGSFVTFNVDGTGDTKRVVFKGTVPEGKQLGSVAVYPASAVKGMSGDNLSLQLSSVQQATVSSSYPGVLVGAIGDDWQVDFKQILGFLYVSLSNFPLEADTISLNSVNALSGTFSAQVSELLEKGLTPSRATSGEGLTLSVKSAAKNVYAMIPLPVADYPGIEMKFIDNKGVELISQQLSEYSTNVTRAELHSMAVACAEVPAPPCRINLGGDRIKMEAVADNVFEGIFEVPAEGQFTIELDGIPYGFATNSGAGGLGIISSDNSALPVAKIRNAGKSKKKYYVKRAIGTMINTELANNPFTLNLESPGSIRVNVDATDPGAPHYNISVVQAADPSVIFHEDFDLCVFGGDYMAPADGKGSTVASYDGYLPGTATPTQNQPNFPMDYPEKVSANVPLDSYMKAYGLQDWTFVYAGERPGAMQLCAGAIPGYMITPAFTEAGAGTDAVLTIDISRFSNSSVDPVFVKLIGGGTFKSAKVVRDAYVSAKAGSSFDEITRNYSEFEDGGTTFRMLDDDYFPHSWDNADIDKPCSHYTFELNGITSNTKLMIDAPKGANNAPRVFVFDIKVTRK